MDIVLVGLWCLLALVSLVFVGFRWHRRHIYKFGDLIPGPPLLPLLGNALYFAGDFKKVHKSITDLFSIYGNIVRVYFGPFLIVFVSNPNDIEIILSSTKSSKRDELFVRALKPFLGEGLITNSGDLWKRHRKIINPSFNHKILETFIENFDKNSQILVQKLDKYANNTTFEVLHDIILSSFDIVYETVMGVTINAQYDHDSDLVLYTERFLDIVRTRFRSPWLYFDWIFNMTSMGKEQINIIKTVDDLVNSAISQKLKEHQTKSLNKKAQEKKSTKKRFLPFLELMIENSESEEKSFNRTELRDEVSTLANAAMETTSTTIAFTLVLLSLYPEHQEKVVQELKTVFSDDFTRPVTPADLHDLVYLERTIKESLRLYPSAPISPRTVQEDLKLTSYTIPAGASTVLDYFVMMRNPEIYPDPLKFDPDRFLPEAVAARSSNTFLPFGMGPRMCIGFKFAMMQMMTVVANILRRYEVLPACTRDDIEDLEAGAILRPIKGFLLKMQPRTFTTVQ